MFRNQDYASYSPKKQGINLNKKPTRSQKRPQLVRQHDSIYTCLNLLLSFFLAVVNILCLPEFLKDAFECLYLKSKEFKLEDHGWSPKPGSGW